MTANDGCRRVQGRLERLVDGSLPPLEEARDRGHLEACAACGAEQERWRALLALTSEALAPDAAELAGALALVEPRLERELRPRRRLRFLRGRTAASLATVAAALVLLLALVASGVGADALASLSARALVPAWELELPRTSNLLGEAWIPDGGAR